jgi:hypothetical protein
MRCQNGSHLMQSDTEATNDMNTARQPSERSRSHNPVAAGRECAARISASLERLTVFPADEPHNSGSHAKRNSILAVENSPGLSINTQQQTQTTPSNGNTPVKKTLWPWVRVLLAGCESFYAQSYDPPCYQIGSAPPVASAGNRGNPMPVTPVVAARAPAVSDNPYDQSVRLFDQVEEMSRYLDQLGQRLPSESAPMNGQHPTPWGTTPCRELTNFPNHSRL